jgi:filamentous hemagglutinin family protein
MIDRMNSVHLCSPGNDRGLSRAERRRALRALRKRRHAARPVRFGLLGAAAFLAAAGVAEPVYAQRGMSGMSGANVVHGDVSFRRTRGGTTITASDGSIIEFERFNIPKRGFVRFDQPGVDATVLNRVVGPGASLIQGTLMANGQVFLVNPSGVTFGPGARVNVGALYAVSGQISNADFRRGIRNFTDLSGAVVNEGVIRAEGGAHLVGSSVQNSGSIIASRGVVTLTAGDNVFLAEQGSSVMVRIDAPGATSETVLPAPGGGVGVENTGTVAGSTVLFSTGDLHSLAIRNEGRVTATGGSVTIDSAGAARNSGVIDASDTSAGGIGGEVRLLGETVVQTGVIDASGDRAGGLVMVGGSFRGQGPERNADTTVITGDSVIRADAVTSGDGGRIAIWGTDGAYVGGEISTRQGALGGTGGFVETSSDALLLSARVDTGVGGAFLVDPVDLTIGGGPEADPLPDSGDFNFDDVESSISANTVEAVLEAGGSLILEAQNNIFVTSDINSAGGDPDGDLTLRAGKSIEVSNNTTIETDANITLQANFYEDGPSATNEIIAAGRTAGDAAITLGSQVNITAGGALSIEVRPTATPQAANGDPVGVSFAVGDITLGAAANDANRVDLSGATVSVTVPNGLITNADVTGTTSVLLHAGTDGTGTHAFSAAANRVTLDGATITLRAGDGTGTEVVDLSTNDPDIVANALIIRQDGAVTSAQLLDGARVGGGLTGFDYTLQSDNGAITLGDRTRVANTDLTLRATDGVTLGANAGSAGLDSLMIVGDADTDGVGNVAIDSAVSLNDGLVSSGVDFGSTGAINSTTGNVDINHSGDVSIGATISLSDGGFESTGAAFTGGGISSTNNSVNITHTGQVNVTGTMSGQAVELRSTGAGVDIGADLSSPNAVSVRADGDITFSAATVLASQVIELVATGAASVVDFSVNAPTVRGVGANAPNEFLQGQGPDMTQADLLTAANFDQGGPSSYTLESGGSIEITDASVFNNTTLFLLAGGDVTLGGGDYTLNGLHITADNDGDDTGNVLITQNVTIAAGPFNSSGVDFTSTTANTSLISSLLTLDHTGDVAITSGARITFGESTVGGSLTVGVDNQDLLSATAIDQFAGTTLTVGEFADLTATGLVTAINLSAADVTGEVRLSTAGDATVVNPGALTLGASTVGGALNATAQDGSLTLAGAVGVTGATTLTATGAASDLVGGVNLLQTSTDVTLNAGRDITISRDAGGALAFDAGRDASITLTSVDAVTLGASETGRDLTLTGSGPVSSAAAIDVIGNASLTVNTGAVLPFAIDLTDLDVGQTLSLNTDGIAQVETASAGGYTLGASSIGVALRAVANNGAIDGTAAVEVGKGALVIPGAVTVLEADSVNLTGLDSVVPIALTTTGDATLTNAGAIVFDGATVGGSLNATATAGSITDDGSILVTNDATFTATGAGGAIALDSASVTGLTSLAATGAVSYTSPNSVRIQSFSAGADSVVEASDINFTGAANSVSASAAGVDLALRPSLATLSVGIGDGFGANTQNFTLSAADLTKLADGFNSITIGRTDSFTNSLILGSGVAFRDAAIFRRPTDALQTTTVNAGVTGTGDASISLFGAAAGVTNLAGDITTQGGAISITGQTTLTGDAELRTTGGGASGGDISTGVVATTVPGANSLTVDAGTTGAVTMGDIGAGGALAGFTLGGATTANLGVVNGAGALAFTANSLNAGAITSTGNQTITFTTDALALSGAVGTQGDLLVQTRTAARDIGVNTAVGGLDLDGATFANLFTGADRNTVTIGRADGSGVITLGAGGLVLADALTLRSPNGEIVLDGGIQMTGAAPLTLTAQTVRMRDSTFTDTGNLTVNGAISIEADGVELGSLAGGGAVVTVGAIDATANQTFAMGGNGDTTLVLTGDIGSSGALGSLGIFADSGVQIGAPSVSITSNGFFTDAAIDSVAGQTNALSLTMVGGGSASLGGVIGGANLVDPATLSAFTINGASTLGGGLVRTTGAQTYTEVVTLNADTLFEGASARFEGGMNAATRNVDVDGAATLAGGTYTAQTLDFLGAVRVDGTSTISGGAVDFASTLDGVSAGSGSLTVDSTAQFNGRVGDAARLASLTVADATFATDVIDATAFDANGQMTLANGSMTVRGTSAEFGVIETTGGASSLTVESASAAFTGTVGAVNELASLTVDGGATLGAGQIRTTGDQTFNGAVTLSSDTDLISSGGGAIAFDSTIDGARTLTLSTTGLSTLGGNVGQTTALLGLNTTGALRIEGGQHAVGAADFAGAVTIANGAVTLTGSNIRFGGAVSSVNGQGNSLAVGATGTTRFDGPVGAGAGALGTLLLNGGGTTVLNTASVNASSVDFDDAVLVDAGSITITAGDIRFDGTLGSVGGESNSVMLTGATTRLGGTVSGLSSLSTDASGTTTLATASIGASQVNFGDNVVLAAPSVVIGGNAVRFVGSVAGQTPGASSLTVNANTTEFNGTVGVGGRINNLVTDAAGTTTIGGSQVAANSIAFNDAVVVDNATLLLNATSVTLATMNAGAGVTPGVTINADTLNINGSVGAGKALGSLTTDAAGVTTINGSVATTGAQVYNDAVTLAGAVSGGSVDFARDVTVGAGASASATGGVRFLGSVGGAGDLTVSASTVEFAKAIGALDVLGSLAVTGDTTLAEGSVTTLGAQSFDGALTLSSDTTFNGEGVSIIGTLRSSDPAIERVVLINDAGETLLSGDFADLVELRTDSAGRTSLAGDFIAGEFLFADDVVLVGDTRIEATGDSGVAFLGRIDSDSDATPRRLTLQIDRNAIADIEAGLAPGQSLEDAIRDRLLIEQRPLPTISFGGDIGSQHALAELRLNADGTRVDPAVYATIIGVNREADGRVSIDSAIDLTIRADRFEMGRNEKFTVLGSLLIDAGSEAILGDITVAQTLSVNVDNDPASRIVLLAREVGSLLAPAEDEEDVLGLVDGADLLDRVDLVAGGSIILSKAPVVDVGGVMVESPLGVVSGSGGTNLQTDDVLFRLFPRSPIPLADLVLRLENGEVFGAGGEPLLFGPGVIDVVLDFTSDGLTLANTTGLEGVTGLFAATAAGVIEDEVLLSQSVRDRLERVGLSARDPLMSELAQALGGRAVYNDYSSEASASDSIGQYAGEIVVNRLPRGAAEQLVAQFDLLVGEDDERLNAFKAALADAYINYYDQAPDEMLDDPRLLAAGFATRVRATQEGSDVDAGLMGVAELLRRIEDIGVTQFEYERALQAVLTTFTPDPDMTLEEFRIVVEWYKNRLVAAPAAAQTPADNAAPAGAEASS